MSGLRHAGVLGAVLLGLGACQSTAGELQSLAQRPPLRYAALVTGGAFLSGLPLDEQTTRLDHTFAGGADGDEPIAMDEILAVLEGGRVFHRLGADDDLRHRREVLRALTAAAPSADAELREFLQRAREAGYDLLLVVEGLQDGPVDRQGVNGRWPITLATWLLFGLGFLIPDHTFESRATLRVTVRDLQTGAVVYDPLLPSGPVDLALVERTDFLGVLLSIIVPPFWVYDDEESVVDGVAGVSKRRLLLSLARDLKSQPTRQRLREGAVAMIDVAREDGALVVRVECDQSQSLSQIRLRLDSASLPEQVEAACQSELLSSVRFLGDSFRYSAPIDHPLDGQLLQILVRTISGGIASITVAPAEVR